MTMSVLSFEQYAAWCRDRNRGYRETEGEEAISTARTEAPESHDSCPVTVRSSTGGVVLTPRPKGSR